MIPAHRVSANETLQDYHKKVVAVWPNATLNPYTETNSSCFIQVAEGVKIWKAWKEWQFDIVLPEHLVGMRERFREAMNAAVTIPNKMNVPTKRAIQNWIKYREDCIAWLEAKYGEIMPVFEADKKIVLELVKMTAQIDKKAGYPTPKVPFEKIREQYFSFYTPLGRIRIRVSVDHRKKEIYFDKELYLALPNENMIKTIKSFQK